MSTEQERAEFEAWFQYERGQPARKGDGTYSPFASGCWRAWQARAALQSQDREDADRIDFLEAEGGGDFLQLKSGEWIVDTSSRFGMAGDLRSAIDHARRIEENE